MLKTIKWFISILVLVVVSGCGQQNLTSLPSTAEELTVEASEPTPPAPTAVPTPSYTSLGSDWEVTFSENAAIGEERVYHHYVTNYVQYDELIVDDELLKIENVCYDQRQDITSMFGMVSAPGEVPQHYQSWSIDFQPNCYIVFTVKNVTGETMGVEFTSHCPICNY